MKILQPALKGLLLLLLESACVMTPKQTILHDFGPAPRGDHGVTPEISVDAPTWLWDHRIRYRLLYHSPTRIGFYALDQWIAPPPELFQQQLIAFCEISGYSLRIRLLDFEQQFDAPGKSHVLINFSVVAFTPGTHQISASREFRLDQATNTPDASGAISGFRSLVKQANELINKWLLTVADRRNIE